MKDKHQRIQADSELLHLIKTSVKENLIIEKQKNAIKLIIKFSFYFLLSSLFYIGIYWAKNPSILILTYTLYGFASLLLAFNFAHDLSHDAVFKSKKLNNFCYILIYTIVGAHAESWKKRHIHSHHYAPNVKDYDADLQITSLIRVEPSTQRQWFHKFQHIYASFAYTSYSLYWIFIKDYFIYFQNIRDKKLNIFYHSSFWMQKIFYLGYLFILPLIFSNFTWFWVISAFIVMHLFQSMFLLFTFFITHHVEDTKYFDTDENGYIKTSWLSNQIRSSNDFHPFSEFANFIFGGFNNHIAHHLFPHINHIYYPKLNKILYKVLHENNFEPNKTTFFSGIMSHLRHLKKMGQKESFVKL